MVKIRSPFFAIERGIEARTTTVFRQKVRRNRCASTMLVTINIRLDRKLLHSHDLRGAVFLSYALGFRRES